MAWRCDSIIVGPYCNKSPDSVNKNLNKCIYLLSNWVNDYNLYFNSGFMPARSVTKRHNNLNKIRRSWFIRSPTLKYPTSNNENKPRT